MLVNNSIPESYKATQILWLALMIGASIITVLLAQMKISEPDFFEIENFLTSIFTVVAVLITFLSIFGANLIVRNRIENLNLHGLSNKFDDFRSNIVLKTAMHEGAALVCVIFMFLESNFYYVFFVLINLWMLFSARPTIEKFKNWYKLTVEENRELDAIEFLPLMG